MAWPCKSRTYYSSEVSYKNWDLAYYGESDSVKAEVLQLLRVVVYL